MLAKLAAKRGEMLSDLEQIRCDLLAHVRAWVESVAILCSKGTPVRYSMAIQLVHENSGALLCLDPQEKAMGEGFAMKTALKDVNLTSCEDLQPRGVTR